MRKVLLLGAIALGLTGCGTATATTSPSTPAPTSGSAPATNGRIQLPVSTVPTSCMLSSGGAQISFMSTTYDVKPYCQNWVQVRAAAGELWNYGQASGSGELRNTCSLSTSDNRTAAIVMDNSSELVPAGAQACEALLATGSWHETP